MAGIPIESLNLSVRATNVLHRMNIHEVEQLLNIPIEYIAEQRNMGVKTIAEIKGAIRQINIGDVSIEDLENLTPADSVNFSKRNFSEEQIEELSYHPITELNLSNRAMNALLKVGCETMAILAEMTLTDIRNMKGLGAKTCDEIWDELNQWIEANMLISEENKDSIISEKEQLFYQWLAGKIKPISPIYWKRLRNIVLNSGYIEMVDWDIEGIDDKFIRKVLALSDFRVSIKNFFLKYAPDGIIEKDAFEKQLALVGLEFDSSILIEIILDDAICIIEHHFTTFP